ncbi:protein kinase [Nocardiopsis sp. FIRDI 009]|uniref:serine/threonine protein kinase n=1 Tax=Nocardiopsis sp. FIRDI 009 TaxID=714197 RepID=UPI000E2763A7|nr:protein kinase [Nocardiopsis sp. FIRDI 009]
MSGSAHAAWAPGYDTSAVLRRGRRARIVRATRATSGADVVLKVLPAAQGRAELDRLRDLSGVPGVVPLLDAGTTAEGDLFVVLPFYADGSFADMLAARGPAPLQEAAAVARSAAAALGAMHGRGLVHNDVSPGNVLRAGRTPVLTGFGSVHPIGAAVPPPPSGSESFLHAPPEALRGEPRTAASDVYQLASTIWTMLVGRTPFTVGDGFDAREYARRVLTEEAPPVGRRDISRKLRGVLTRALAKAPQERYGSAAEFAAAFEQARTSRPVPTVSGASGAQAPLSGAAAPEPTPADPYVPGGAQPPTTVPPTTAPEAPSTGPRTPSPYSVPSGEQVPHTPQATRPDALASPASAHTQPSGPQTPPTSRPAPAGEQAPHNAQAAHPAATPHAGPSDPQAPHTAPSAGAQPPLSGPHTAPSGAHTPPTGPPRPHPSPYSVPSGEQTPHTPQEHLPAPPYAVSGPAPAPASPTPHPGTGPRNTPAGPPSAPPGVPAEHPSAPASARLDGARQLRGDQSAAVPGDDQSGSRLPATDAGGTAEIMMARLRGEEISPLLAWSRVEGWSGTAESARLPEDGAATPRDEAPGWSALHEPDVSQARWRRHLHLAASVCGILLLTSVSGAFASTGPQTPILSAAEPEEPAAEPSAGADASAGDGEAADDGTDETVEPTVPEPIGAPTEVRLEDTLNAVRLSWTDNSGGTAPFFVVGGPQHLDPTTLARTGAGVTSAQITTTDTYGEYCFTVVAVDGASAPAEEVCTTRAADRAAAAAAEAEEEAAEEDEAEPSDAPSPAPGE